MQPMSRPLHWVCMKQPLKTHILLCCSLPVSCHGDWCVRESQKTADRHRMLSAQTALWRRVVGGGTLVPWLSVTLEPRWPPSSSLMPS